MTIQINRRSALAAGLALGISACATANSAAAATIRPAPEGAPNIGLGDYDLASLGYRRDEFFISGTATSFEQTSPESYDVRSVQSAPYLTRIVIVRPEDAAQFNGTTIVEWMNVSGGEDLPVAWIMAHTEMMRSGFAYVGVSAQIAGIEGGRSPVGTALKVANPERYSSLAHPGDAYAYDIFSQVGEALQASSARRLFGGVAPQHVIAAGQSQSAAYMTTYINRIDPVARVYDGFLVHSRFAGGSSLAPGGGMSAGIGAVAFREDLRVPVLTVETETDLVGPNGYHSVRVPDTDMLRVWEVVGTAHGDSYLNGFGLTDSGALPIAQIAQGYAPSRQSRGFDTTLPINSGIVHHYAMQAAIRQLHHWLDTSAPPASAPPLQIADDGSLVLDANGIARGGLRTPWVDVPTVRLTGVGNSGSPVAGFVGVGEPFDAARLAELYPNGKAGYLSRFEASLDTAIANGFLLAADRQEILALAAEMYPDR